MELTSLRDLIAALESDLAEIGGAVTAGGRAS